MAADVNGDGRVDSLDVDLIVAFLERKITRFPAEG